MSSNIININTKYNFNIICDKIISLLELIKKKYSLEINYKLDEIEIKESIEYINFYINELLKKYNIFINEKTKIDNREITSYVLIRLNDEIISKLHNVLDKPQFMKDKQKSLHNTVEILHTPEYHSAQCMKNDNNIINEFYDDDDSEFNSDTDFKSESDSEIYINDISRDEQQSTNIQNCKIEDDYSIIEYPLDILIENLYNIVKNIKYEIENLIKNIDEYNNSWFFWLSNINISMSINNIKKNNLLIREKKNILHTYYRI